MKAKTTEVEVSILEVKRGHLEFCILGTTPLIYHAMSQKVKQQLLDPTGRKNAAEKAGSRKHNPLQEFRDSMYYARSGNTELMLPTVMFKGALCNAALDMPGAKKTQMGRLVHVHGWETAIYGIPQMFMNVTRSSDKARTPDVRTRAILPKWACKIGLTFIKPIMREQTIANLLASAGMTIGIGDFRSEKGKGNNGSFEIVSADNAEFLEICEQGKELQQAAIADPSCFDFETQSLYDWHNTETIRRGFKVAA